MNGETTETAAAVSVNEGMEQSSNFLAETSVRALPPIALMCALLLVWEVLVRVMEISALVLPAPSAIAVNVVAEAEFYLRHFVVTGIEVVVGLFFAIALGCSLGMVIAFSKSLGSAVYPLIIGAQVTPKVAIAPLLLIWFGFELTPKVILTALISFFPIVISMIVGLNAARREQVYLFRSMGAGGTQTFFKLLVPAALPVFFGGLKVAATLSVIGAVIGEFTSASSGLGYVLLFSAGTLDTTAAFASVFYLVILGLLVFLVVILVERLVIPAHMRQRIEETSQSM